MSTLPDNACVPARSNTATHRPSLPIHIGTLLLLNLVLAGLMPMVSASAATITVGSTSDPAVSNAANCNAASTCTLRDAIARAADVTGAAAGDTIVFGLPANSTITLGGSALIVDRNLTIDGSASPGLAVSGNNASRVFEIRSGVAATLNQLVIRNGYVDDLQHGGGIANYGSLVLSDSTVSDNKAAIDGGGIHNGPFGTVTLTNSTVSDNTAPTGGGIFNDYGGITLTDGSAISGNAAEIDGGGGIHNRGTLVLTDSSVTDNTSTSDYANGGGIYNHGSATLTRSSVSNNTVDGGYGGGIYNRSNLTLVDSTVSNNTATNAADVSNGGGIWNGAILTLTNSAVYGNMASDYGGGIYSWFGSTLTLTHSTISDNTSHQGGGIWSDSSYYGGGFRLIASTISGNSASYGGGIFNTGKMTLTDSTVSTNISNQYGGGIANSGQLMLTNSMVADNTTTDGDGGGIHHLQGELIVSSSTVSGNAAHSGGGICSDYSTPIVSNSTISNNTAIGGDGGGIYNWKGDLILANSTASGNEAIDGAGGGIYSFNGSLRLVHGTLAGNIAAGANSDVYHYHEYAIWTSSAVNTIIQDCAVDGYGTRAFVDNGGNLDGGSGCGFTDAGSKSNATLALGALSGNGGPTLTMIPAANSDAIGRGLASACSGAPVNNRDQRGYVRPAGTCTSGAADPDGLADESIFFDGFGFGGL